MQIPPTSGPHCSLRGLIGDSFRFWELRRLLYNLVLSAVVVAWVTMTWPHFRPMFDMHSLLSLAILGLLANSCYCAAYLVDIPIQITALGNWWRRHRGALWLTGMLFAVLLANYWIVDEIYPFVR
jgi:hypothetical protein